MAQGGTEAPERVFFYQKEGLIYRHWHPQGKEINDVRAVEHLVLPARCRPLVLRLAHDIPTAGHLGMTKTRLLARGVWRGGRVLQGL